MKRYLYAVAAIAFAASCARNGVKDDYGDGVAPFISVPAPSLQLPNLTADTSVLVSSNVWWNIAVTKYSDGSSDWVTGIDPSALNANRKVTFTMIPNLYMFPRTATVTIAPRIAGATDDCTFTLVQAASGPFANVSGDEINAQGVFDVGVVANTSVIGIQANAAWTIDNTNCPWMTFTPSSGVVAPYDTIAVSCVYSDNPYAPANYRDGSFTVKYNNGLSKVVQIHQDKIFSPTVLSVDNGETLIANWKTVAGTATYTLQITDLSTGASVANIAVPAPATTYNLGTYFAANPYPNSINVTVKSASANPLVFSESDVVATSPSFGNGSGDGLSPGQAWVISSLRHLKNVGNAATVTLPRYYKMTSSFDLTGQNWTAIGTDASRFGGFFDGGGNKISHLSPNATSTINSTALNPVAYWGLFGVTGDGSIVKNLAFENCSVTILNGVTTAPQGFGFAVGSNNGGTIDNITVKTCSIFTSNGGSPTAPVTLVALGSANGIGLVAGSNNPGKTNTTLQGLVSNCVTSADSKIDCLTNNQNAATIIAAGVGGIVGMGANNTMVSHCTNNAPLNTRNTTGGIVGQNGSVEYCCNTAMIAGGTNTSGIMGLFNTGTGTVTYSYNTGMVLYRYGQAAYNFGGIVGYVNGGTSIIVSQCYNTGDVTTTPVPLPPGVTVTVTVRPNNFGGIVGCINGGTATVNDCYNTGYIRADNGGTTGNPGLAGGIVGRVNVATATVTACYSVGKTEVQGINSNWIESTGAGTPNYAAGVVGGRLVATSVMQSLYFITGNAGGFAKAAANTTGWDGTAIFNRATVGGNMASSTSAGAIDVPVNGKSSADLQNPATYDPSFDFGAIWEAPNGGYPYPQLRAVHNPGSPATVAAPRRW